MPSRMDDLSLMHVARHGLRSLSFIMYLHIPLNPFFLTKLELQGLQGVGLQPKTVFSSTSAASFSELYAGRLPRKGLPQAGSDFQACLLGHPVSSPIDHPISLSR
eukprot:1150339-Pelagomonas_calceolata.AAC.1